MNLCRNLGSCYPTPAAKTTTPLGWGTHISWRVESGRLGFVLSQVSKSRPGAPTFRGGWRVEGRGSCDPRSQNRDLGHPHFVAGGEWKVGVRAIPGLKIETWGTHILWRVESGRSGFVRSQVSKSRPGAPTFRGGWRVEGWGSCDPRSQNRDLGHPHLVAGGEWKYYGSSKGDAKRAPYQRMPHAMTSETSVAPRPMLRFEWSLMAPIICGEKVSPKA